MKKLLITMLALMGLIMSLSALPRNLVVVEVATGTWCGYCPGAAMGCHDLLDNGHPVAIIKNHGSDSYANVYSNARNSFYGVTGYPTAFFDGLNPTVGGSASSSMYSNYLPKVNARMAVASHYTISALGNADGSNYTVVVTVAKPEADTNTNVKLHAVLTESNIPQVWFNQTTVENVNRLMVPDQNGTVIDLATGGQTTVNLNFTVNAGWNIANCEMVFFLQNMTSKEILQGVKYSLASLVGAYPVSHQSIDFPDTYVTGSATVPITITNFASTTATGTLTFSNPAFSASATTFSIPATQSAAIDITFTPTAAQNYTGNLNIISNLYNHPDIDIPLTGLGFTNVAPVAVDVSISGPPVLYQAQTGNYTFSDADGNTEGTSIYKWYRIINDNPVLIDDANEISYNAVEADLGIPIAFEVTPVDQHGMPGTPVMSAPTIPIEVLPPPQNFAGVLQPPDTVVLTWQRPLHFEGRGLVGYRLFRDGLTISTITNPNTLTFTDTYVNTGIHEYWICSMFNEPYMLSEPSPIVTINVGVDNDDQVAPVQSSLSVYPNPFASSTTLSIQSKAAQNLELAIYNQKGQLIRSFGVTTDASGTAQLTWNGNDADGKRVHSGVYYYRLSGNAVSRQGKIILMK